MHCAYRGFIRSVQTNRDQAEEVTENSRCRAPFSACFCTNNRLLPPPPPEDTSCGNTVHEPYCSQGSLRLGTSATSLLPLSLHLAPTGNQRGQGMVLTHSLNTDSRYSELGAPRNKVAWSLPPSHPQVTLWRQKYMPNNRRVWSKDYIQIRSKLKTFCPQKN